MKEYKIIIDGKLYNLPLAKLYIDKFSEYLEGNVINPDKMAYPELDSLFGFIVNSFCIMDGSEYSIDIQKENLEIRKKVESKDRMQKFFKEKGDFDKSRSIILNFCKEIFLHLENIVKEDNLNNGMHM